MLICQFSKKCIDKKNMQFLRSLDAQKDGQKDKCTIGKSGIQKWTCHL